MFVIFVMKASHFILPLTLILLAAIPGVAQCDFEEFQEVTDPNGALSDWFGYSVSVDGDVAIVGSRLDDDAGQNFGSAFIYRFDGTAWIEEQKILGLPIGPGGPVAIENDVAIVARGGVPDVFRFNGTTWLEETVLPVVALSLSLDNGVLIVGSSNQGVGGTASIFSHDGTQWVLEDTISANDASFNDQFGSSVSMDGRNRVAIVGARANDDACQQSQDCDSGSSYIFRFDGSSWVQEQKITASNAEAQDNFGEDVSIRDDVAVVGPLAYVFRFDGTCWVEEQILSVENVGLGTSVVLGERGLLAVGGIAPRSEGSAHIFRFDGLTWINTQNFSPAGIPPDNDFGFSMDISGDVLLVGARLTDGACPMNQFCDSGSAYFFQQTFDCSLGTVNTGLGSATDVLFVNGSAGNDQAIVNVSLSTPVTFTLNVAPAGSLTGDYLLYVWTGFPVQCRSLMAMGELIGCMVNPTPLLRSQAPQPFRCLRSSSIPNIICRGVVEKTGPATIPWNLTLNQGFQEPAVFTLQGLIRDEGAGNSTGFSVTNAATVVAE